MTKETTFGWYPPAKDRWQTHNQAVQSYNEECLFRYADSRYNDRSGISTPQIPTKFNLVRTRPGSKTSSRSKSKASSAKGSRQGSIGGSKALATPLVITSPPRLESRASSVGGVVVSRPPTVQGDAPQRHPVVRIQSAVNMRSPTPLGLKSPSIHQSIDVGRMPSAASSPIRVPSERSTPMKAWDIKPAATPLTIEPAHMGGSPLGKRSPSINSLTRSRVQSAKLDRPRTSPPKRPVQSAGPVRPPSGQTSPRRETPRQPPSPAKSESIRPASGSVKLSDRPASGKVTPQACSPAHHEDTAAQQTTPRPTLEDVQEEVRDEFDDDLRPSAPIPPGSEYAPTPVLAEPLDYQTELQKHGWRMEVHGDPFGLKKPCLPRRFEYSYKLDMPVIKPNPPKVHMEQNETFFLNTIPRKPMSFTVHPEWISEVLAAKRKNLIKKEGGYNYRTTNYGFVY